MASPSRVSNTIGKKHRAGKGRGAKDQWEDAQSQLCSDEGMSAEEDAYNTDEREEEMEPAVSCLVGVAPSLPPYAGSSEVPPPRANEGLEQGFQDSFNGMEGRIKSFFSSELARMQNELRSSFSADIAKTNAGVQALSV